MVFLSPLALFALAVALVPPLLHLFQRRHPPEVVFPAVRYLRESEREAERRVRLQHLLLMLMRVLAVVLIVLAAARPVVPGGGGGLHEPTAVAIVLDNSLSSGAVSGGARVADDLVLRAREALRASGSGDALWVMGADGVARGGSREELLEAVSRMAPDERRLELPRAIGQAARLVSGAGFPRREVHVLTDLQATALEGEATSEPELRGLPVIAYAPDGAAPVNRGVVAARARPALQLAGAGVVVAGVGGAPAPEGRVAIAAGFGSGTGARSLAAAGEEVSLALPRAEAGWRVGEVSIEPDELRADDARSFAVRFVAPASVMVDPGADVGRFLGDALATLADGGHVRQVPDGTEGAWLVGDVARGVRAVLLPPADPTRLGAANRALAAIGFPWRLGARLEREDTLVASLAPEAAGARVRARHVLERVATGGEVLALGGGEPWLVRSGEVVLLASRLVPDETDLPLRGTFVPFVSALLNRYARGESGIIEAAPGESVRLPGRARTLVLGPDSAVPLEGGAIVSAPGSVGAYAILDGRDTVAVLVVGADPRESDLRRADLAGLRRALPGARVELARNPDSYAAARFQGAGRTELTGWLLAAALVVLLAESLLAAGAWRRTT